MDVAKLLHKLRVVPDIEIVIALLPEVWASRSPGKSLNKAYRRLIGGKAHTSGKSAITISISGTTRSLWRSFATSIETR